MVANDSNKACLTHFARRSLNERRSSLITSKKKSLLTERRASLPSGPEKIIKEICGPHYSLEPQEGTDIEFELPDSVDQTLKNSQGTVAPTVFYAHRNILSERSEYFRILLNNGMRESTATRIVISDVPVEMFSAVLDYIYSGKLKPDFMNVVSMFETCDLFLLEEGKNICQQYIESMPLVFLSRLLFEDNLLSSGLLSVCCIKAARNATYFFCSPQIQQLTKAAFITLLKSDALALREIDVFHGVREWLAAHQDEDVDSIIELVRFPLMDYSELVDQVEPLNVVPVKLLLEAFKHLARPQAVPLTEEQRLNPRFTPRVPQEALAGGTKVYTLPCSEAEHEHCKTLAWRITNLSTITSQRHMSDVFELWGLKWRLWVYAAGEAKHSNSFSVYLEAIRTPDKEGYDFMRNISFLFSLVHPSDKSSTRHQPASSNVLFTADKCVWGNGLVELKELYEKSLGYIKNDSVVIHLHLLSCIAVQG